MSQSSKRHLSRRHAHRCRLGTARRLLPAIKNLRDALDVKAREFAGIVKSAATHLQDATPLTLGQEFSGYVNLSTATAARVAVALDGLYDLPSAATAVGTGLNAHPEFAERAARKISEAHRVAFPLASQ